MKVYLVKRSGGVDRWFESQQELTNFLINTIGDEECSITVLEGNSGDEISAKQFLKQLGDEIQRDATINVVLGDEYSEKAKLLISKFQKLAKRSPLNQTKLTPNGEKVLEKLMTTEQTKDEFSKVVKKNSEFLLYNVSDTIEWYSILLDVYPFKKLDECCRTEFVSKQTGGVKWNGHRTPDKMITNFEKAKLKKKKPQL